MIDGTRRQWHHFCIEHGLNPVERMILYGLVHDHSAPEGFTRPGIARLATLSGAHRETVSLNLATFEKRGWIEVHRASSGRRATEYRIPWLRNGPVDNRTDAAGNPVGTPVRNPAPSSPLRGDRRSTPHKSGVPAAAPSPDDATRWCGLCEEWVADQCANDCADCFELIGCVRNPKTEQYYADNPDAWRSTPPLRVVRS